MMEKDLPKGWVLTSIKEVNQRKSKNIKPFEFPGKKFESYSVPVFETGNPEIVDGKDIKSSKQIVEQNEVLISKINPRINRVWKVADHSNFQKICSSEWIIVNTKDTINPDFLRYEFSAPFFRSLLQSEVSGVGGSLTRARPKLVENYNFPLPPLAEQQRIVTKLDSLFGRLEEVKTRLANIPTLLKNFRQAILTQAVTGKLTEEWRGEMKKEGKELGEWDLDIIEIEKEKLKKEFSFQKGRKKYNHKLSIKPVLNETTKGISKFLDLPDSWSWVSLDQVVWNLSDGPHFSPKYVNKEDGKRFISMRNVSYSGIDFSDAKYVSKSDHIEFLKRGSPHKGDLLLTKGGSTGIPCVVQDDIDFSYWVHVALLKPIKLAINSYYLKMTLASPLGYEQSQAFTHGVGNQDLGLTRMIHIAFPLPQLEEQTEIVRRVENLFAKADTIEAKYNNLKTQIDHLPQAILAKAFRGELVEQLPTDGDAKDLLREIEELRAGENKGKSGKRKGRN